MTQPHGIIAAVLTPLGTDLAPDFAAFIAYGRQLLEAGCHCLGMLGTTGEANSIHIRDRLHLIVAAAEALPTDRLLIGTGSSSLAEAVELTRCAAVNGAKAVLVLPPYYYAPVTDAGVQAYYDRLIDSVADADLRIYLYNFPKLTGYRFSPALIETLMARHGPVIAGLKDSSGDFASMTQYAAIDPGFRVFAGTERYLLDILDVGGAGCISATLNVTAALARKVWDGRAAPDARLLQASLTALRAAVEPYPLVPALKTLAARSGDAVWGNLLPPHIPLDTDAREQLLRAFDAALEGAGL